MSDTGRLFDPGPAPGAVDAPDTLQSTTVPVDGTVVRVLPDVSGLDKEFDYVVPHAMSGPVEVGTEVRVELNGRRVNGWIVAVDPPDAMAGPVQPVLAIRSVGPGPEVVELARWAAHRWQGRVGAILKTASPPRVIRSLQRPSFRPPPVPRSDVSVIRHGPGDDVLGWLAEAAERGSALVVVPSLQQARSLAGRLRRRNIAARVHPDDWAAAAGRGGVVIGARSAVWATVADLATIIVVDEHDEAHQNYQHPTWHARDVAVERARRAGIGCWLLSPAPTLEALAVADHQRSPARARERAAWPVVEVIDRRDDEPGRRGLFSSRLVEVLRSTGPALAVLNRKGRAVMLACGACGEPALTLDGERMMTERDGRLACVATGEERPLVCTRCGSTKLKRLRLGVTRAAEELSALLGESVDELSADHRPDDTAGHSRVVVGTEAALHQLPRARTVAFLDFDQELLAPRYRAAEQAMVLLVRAAQLVGGRDGGGHILVQTRAPGHRVLDAAVLADPGRLADGEREIRRAMGFPPFGALAELSGAGAAELAAALETAGHTVLGPRDDERYLLRADDGDALADALADAPRPAGRVRVAVDPLRA
ncbi:MAG: hypothetical protein AAGD35_09110 [Actinomycetota bacterium]